MMAAMAGSIGINMFGAKMGLNRVAGVAAEGMMDYVAASEAAKHGGSFGGALATNIAFSIGQAVFGTGPMMAIAGATLAAQLDPAWYQAARQNAGVANQAYLGSFGGGFQLSQTAATMREVGMRAIQENGYNLRSVLGSEARKYTR